LLVGLKLVLIYYVPVDSIQGNSIYPEGREPLIEFFRYIFFVPFSSSPGNERIVILQAPLPLCPVVVEPE
jgi:hypothetical protein